MSTTAILYTTIVALPFVGALAILVVRRHAARSVIAAIAVSSVTLSTLLLLMVLANRDFGTWRVDWVQALGIGFGWRVDFLSLFFALIVLGGGLLTMAFSVPYWRSVIAQQSAAADHQAAYYASMLVVVGATLGIFFSEDLFQLYVFWELTDIASFLLIGTFWADPDARHAALKALMFKALGGLCMLMGFVLLTTSAGTSSITELIGGGWGVHGTVFYASMVLVLIGAAVRSAQFPFHVWLPNTMIAPTPVNAYLDSSSLLIAGPFLLLQLSPVFESTAWFWILIAMGVVSMFTGGVLALLQKDLKWLLAYSTISQFGFIFALIGLGVGPIHAALWLVIQHAVLKSGLFFLVGAIERGSSVTGHPSSRAPNVRLMAIVTGAVLALSLGGLPPLGGFWMKESFFHALLAEPQPLLLLVGISAAALTLVYMLKFVWLVYPELSTNRRGGTIPMSMLIIPAMLAFTTLAIGLFPNAVWRTVIEPAALSLLTEQVRMIFSYHLSLEFLMSVIALGSGVLIFMSRNRWQPVLERGAIGSWWLDAYYQRMARGTMHLGQVGLLLQNGSLPRYLYVMMLAFAGVVFLALPELLGHPLIESWNAVPLLEDHPLVGAMRALSLILIAAGTLMVLISKAPLRLILILGGIGFTIGALFGLVAAPDVGLLQVHVETLATVLLVIILVRIPKRLLRRSVGRDVPVVQSWYALLPAGILGLGSAVLSVMAIAHLPTDPVAPWYNLNAERLVGAKDVVAAILIYFRSLDTLGEIVVFAIATIGVLVFARLARE